MKKASIHIVCMLLALVSLPQLLSGQQAPEASLLRSPLFREKLMLTTDRTLYAAGERILFRVFNFSDSLLKEDHWSMVLYLELISERHVAVARGKFTLAAEGASGQLTIPDSVTTGNYVLRAYTRWMRNFTADAFATLSLGVVNPDRTGPVELFSAVPDSLLPGSNEHIPGSMPGRRTAATGISLKTEHSLYRKGEQVTLLLQTDESPRPEGGYALSVVRKAFLDLDQQGLSTIGRATIGDDGIVAYPPDTRGISVSGTIVQRTGRQPVPFARMHVTLLGETPDYYEMSADQQGNVRFSVPARPGVSNALIAFDREKGASFELVVDEAFSREFAETRDPGPGIINRQPGATRELAMISQLRKAFDLQPERNESSADSLINTLFYGTPEYRYRTADYVAIPNLGEFLFELVPQVAVQRVQGQRILSVMDDAGYFLEYAPLILLDHVNIQDMEALLAIDPGQLSTIDVVNTIYIRGSNIYGGIISLISREGNLAGVGLPEGATIIELQTVERLDDLAPQDFIPPSRGERLPDLRSTLFWDPDVELRSGEQRSLEFPASDIPGTYVAILTGVTQEGKVIRSACEFDVE